MNNRSLPTQLFGLLVFLSLVTTPVTADANLLNYEKEIYMVQPLITEPAWTQSGLYLNSFLFDHPNAVSRPYPEVGFVLNPGLRWALFDMFELAVSLPVVLNADGTFNEENSQSADELFALDDDQDLDLPGLVVGLKAHLLGKKKNDRFLLAVGVNANLSLFEDWSTTFMPPKTTLGNSTSHRINPYVTMAYSMGRFSPQLQLGAAIRMKEKIFDLENPGQPLKEKGYTDFFFNLALPFAFLHEHTAPMLEINGVFGEQGSQIFVTPAVTFLPKGSPALVSFACMLPVFDSDFSENEGVRFLINFSYRLDVLSVPAFWKSDEESTAATENPPAGW